VRFRGVYNVAIKLHQSIAIALQTLWEFLNLGVQSGT
jgi:hypothetical protein